MKIISLGAGVQSSVMALMSSRGELPKVDCAIFADTQVEPQSVYTWLDWLEKNVSFPIYRVTKGNLAVESTRIRKSKKSGNYYQKHTVPAYLVKADGKLGMLPRHCTLNFKIQMIQRKVRELVGRKGHADVWIGISTDEAHRMKPSRDARITNVWPLIDAGLSRQNCLDWAAKNNLPKPPRSSCVFCPYHSDSEWIRLKNEEPEAFVAAALFEKQYQKTFEKVTAIDGVPFLHRSAAPLEDVVFKTDDKKKDGFGNECEGMCGV